MAESIKTIRDRAVTSIEVASAEACQALQERCLDIQKASRALILAMNTAFDEDLAPDRVHRPLDSTIRPLDPDDRPLEGGGRNQNPAELGRGFDDPPDIRRGMRATCARCHRNYHPDPEKGSNALYCEVCVAL
jgi:hypothetical protein